MNWLPDGMPAWVVAWFPVILFAIWSLTSLISAVARFRRWQKYQRQKWLLTDSIKQGLMAISFSLASLIVTPHPLYDYRWLTPYSRLSWALALVPFLIGSFYDWFGQAKIEHERSKP